jgi:hypothetical protein
MPIFSLLPPPLPTMSTLTLALPILYLALVYLLLAIAKRERID